MEQMKPDLSDEEHEIDPSSFEKHEYALLEMPIEVVRPQIW
jgi:hypothetical protein